MVCACMCTCNYVRMPYNGICIYAIITDDFLWPCIFVYVCIAKSADGLKLMKGCWLDTPIYPLTHPSCIYMVTTDVISICVLAVIFIIYYKEYAY